jgi:hypothetical protein
MDIGLRAPAIIGELGICSRMPNFPITNAWMRIHHIMMYKESEDIYEQVDIHYDNDDITKF